MTTHTITLARHTAQVVGLMGVLVLGTWDSYGTEQLLLRHGPEWDGLAIDATFHNTPSDEGVTMLVDADGLVPVPPEACMQPSKYATITFRGVQDGVQRISCNLPYMVLDHAQVPGANSTATPSENAQALAQMQDLRDGAVDAKNQAEAARDNAAKSAVDAKESETNAGQSATAAAKSAADAKNTLESIQADYSKLSGKVNDNTSWISELKEDLADKVPKKDYAPETKTESMTQPVGKDENGKLWTTPGSVFAVSSVNGKTGAVVLTADDVHAMRDDTVIPTVPDKVSAFENDAGYLTAHQDISGKLDADKLPEAVNDALAQAAASGEFDGADGKSAYQYAVEGGYTGAEAEFAAKMAAEQLTGTTNELTPKQVYDAVSAGIPVKVQYFEETFGWLSYTNFSVAETMNAIAANTIVYFNGVYILGELLGDKSDNTWVFMATTLAQKTDIPTTLPNPHALTFTGAVTGTYDGSEPLSVQIPSAVTDDHINELINTALNAIGVAEEGAY